MCANLGQLYPIERERGPVHSFLHLSRNLWVLDHCNEEQQQEEHRMQQDDSVDAGKDTPERMHLALPCQECWRLSGFESAVDTRGRSRLPT